jgi:hypothetical protein
MLSLRDAGKLTTLAGQKEFRAEIIIALAVIIGKLALAAWC